MVDIGKILSKLENPTYFMCSRKDIPSLTARAQKEAELVLRDFLTFYRPARPITIEIYPREYATCYSIAAKLIWDGNTVIRDESDASLLFLELNECVLNRMIKLGWASGGVHA